MEKKNKSHIRFAKARYSLETFKIGHGNFGARIALWLCTFWLRFLYELGPVRKFKLDISGEHPLIDDLMVIDKSKVNGEYARLVHELRRHLNLQKNWDKHLSSTIGSLFPEGRFSTPNFWNKLSAFFIAFFPSGAPSAWEINVSSDVD
ncbi:MAG: hypothetical protein R3B39_00200 [Candidatus Paceibacterota bacterium]